MKVTFGFVQSTEMVIFSGMLLPNISVAFTHAVRASPLFSRGTEKE